LPYRVDARNINTHVLENTALVNITRHRRVRAPLTPCSFGLSATSQLYFSLRTNQPSATSQQYFFLRTNQHQPSAKRTGYDPSRILQYCSVPFPLQKLFADCRSEAGAAAGRICQSSVPVVIPRSPWRRRRLADSRAGWLIFRRS
jgi:hypothetical protein